MIMEIKRKFNPGVICIMLLVFLATLNTAVAQSTPQETIEKMTSEMIKQESPAPIVDYVHWATAYKSLTAEESAAMKVNSPEELKRYSKSMLEDPVAFMREQMQANLGDIPAEQRQFAEQAMAGMINMVEAEHKKMAEDMKNTTYKVGETTVNGDTAKVELLTTLDGETKTDTIELQKIEGRWYLPSLGMGSEGDQDLQMFE